MAITNHWILDFFLEEVERQNTNICSVSDIDGSITSTCLYSWKNGHRNPSVENLDKALKVLGYELTVRRIDDRKETTT